MAIALKICVTNSADCESLVITDKTESYSSTNPGGWESPNPALNTALTATINIAKRNSDGTWTTSEDSPIDVYPTFPSVEDAEVTITGEDAGYGVGSNFEDGVYRTIYTVTGNDGEEDYTYTTTYYFSNTCAIDCCYQQAAVAASVCNCACDDINNKLKNIAFYRRLLKSSECCGNLQLIQKYIDLLTKLCADCGSCDGGGCC